MTSTPVWDAFRDLVTTAADTWTAEGTDPADTFAAALAYVWDRMVTERPDLAERMLSEAHGTI